MIEGEIDEQALIWLNQHPDGMACERCPHCITFPLMAKLSKVCSHVSLLQPKRDPDSMDPSLYSEAQIEEVRNELRFAEIVFEHNLLDYLPNNSLIRNNSITDNHHAMSGKVRTGGK